MPEEVDKVVNGLSLRGMRMKGCAAVLLLVVAVAGCTETASNEPPPTRGATAASMSPTLPANPVPEVPNGLDFRGTAVDVVKKTLLAQGSTADDFDLSCEGAYVDSTRHWVERCAEGSIQGAGGLEIWMRVGDDQTIDAIAVSSDDACSDQPAWLVEMAKHNGNC